MTDRRLPPHTSQIIDRSKKVTFQFDGRTIPAYEGDTIASALYASGTSIFNRSFKYHRPRGLLCVSGRCPNCMMKVDGVPNIRACTRLAAEGAKVNHQNAWPSLDHDALSILERFDRLMPVGFYYKSLIHPKAAWHLAEPVIRRIAGLGSVDPSFVPDGEYEHLNLFTDVAVVGGGPAGCQAAISAAEQGARVILIDDQPSLGGHLRAQTRQSLDIDEYSGLPDSDVARKLAQAVFDTPNISLMSNASVFGVYEGKLLGIHHGNEMVKLRCKRIVIATGAQEVPMVFPNNDLPGVLLSSGVLRLVNLYGVRPGRRGVVVINNDQGLACALEMLKAEVTISAVADSRPSADQDSALVEALLNKGVGVLPQHAIWRAEGKKRVNAAKVGRLEDGRFIGNVERIACDFICTAQGFESASSLLYQADCKLVYDSQLGETVPLELAPGVYATGDVTGIHDANVSLLQGKLTGLEAGASLAESPEPQIIEEIGALQEQVENAETTYRSRLSSSHLITIPVSSKKKFVCVCEDVTEKDLRDAIDEGFEDIQSLKRYSTISMGPCQGKMCLKACVNICAAENEKSIEEIGSTTPRSPVSPVPMGALAGPGHMAFRFTPIHHKHIEMGGNMMEVGQWKRPRSYGSPQDEVRAVRERVGIIDVSTLGKLDVRGSDAPKLMDKVYTHFFSNLAVGRIRYGMICSDSGVILDDGTVTRLEETSYYVTTGSGNTDLVEEWFKWWIAGTGMCAHITNITAGFAAINVAGPRARDTLSKLTDVDISTEGFKYMRSASGMVAGVPSLLLRVGFVGEAGWEIHCPAEYGEHMWEALLDAGQEFDISPFGVEAQRILRLEKKHLIPGQDTDLASNPLEADMGWAVKFEKDDFIGRSALKEIEEQGLRNKLVGFVMQNGAIPGDGVPVMLNGRPVGKVTSSRYSPTLNQGFGLVWVPIELAQDGKDIGIKVGKEIAPAKITIDPVYDPTGERLRG